MFLLSAILVLFSVGAIAKSVVGVDETEDGLLNLTPLIQRGEASKARSLSTVDPKLFANVPSHAAFINVNVTEDWNTFFWFFPVENKPLDSTPWVIWLQGGPGVSSLYGLFKEIGPLQYTNGTLSRSPVTWGSDYSLLFIDNPVGAGFSYSGKSTSMKNEDDVGASLVSFIQQFVQVFPELQKAPLFVAGESYAGKYIPAFGHYLHHHQNKTFPINLKGLVIGDGFTDPPTLLYYSELAQQFGFEDPEGAAKIKTAEDETRKAWNDGDFEKYKELADYVFKNLSIVNVPNIYNIIKDKYDIEHNEFKNFLAKTSVRNALHVANVSYSIESNAVVRNFSDDMYRTVKPWLEELLEHYGVLCYNGQLDYIIGYALSVHTYHSLKWSGANAYLNASRVPIPAKNHDGSMLDPIGYMQSAGNFMEVMIRSAGHMVAEDQPLAAKQVLDMFINKFK